MSTLRYDFDSDASSLVRAAGQSVSAMGKAEKAAEELAASMGKLGGSQDKAAKDAQRAAIEQEKAVKRFEREYIKSLEAQEKAQRKAVQQAQREAIEREKAVKKFEREYIKSLEAQEKAQRKAAQEAEKAARAQSNSFADVARSLNSSPIVSNVEAIGSIFIQLGGVVSRLSILFTTLVRPISVVGTMLGPAAPLALGLAAIPAAALAAAAATKAAIDSLVELGETAVKVADDVKGIVPPEVSNDLLIIEQGIEALEMQGKILTATLASDMSPAINGAINFLLGLGKVAYDASRWVVWLTEKVDTSSTAFRVLHGVLSLGSSEVARSVAGVGEEVRKQIDGSLAPYLDQWEKIEKAAGDAGSAWEDAGKRIKQGDEDAKKETEERKKALDALADAYTYAIADMLTAEGELQAATNEQIAKLLDLKLTEEELSDVIIELKKREQREINALYDERVKNAFKTLDSEREAAEAFARDTERVIQEMEADTREFQAEQAKDLAEKLEKEQAAMESALMDLAHSFEESFSLIGEQIVSGLEAARDEIGALADESESRIDELEQKAEDMRGRNKERAEQALAEEQERLKDLEAFEHKTAMNAFRTGQALAVSQALIAGALAIVQAYAQLGPVAGSVAAVGVTALTATQIGVIEAQDPPERRHDGGADEFVFQNRTVRNGESQVVFNQRATESGALERAAQMNRDMDEGSGREVRLVMADAGRVVGELVTSEMSRPGSRLRSAVGTRNYGQRDPYGRGRR